MAAVHVSWWSVVGGDHGGDVISLQWPTEPTVQTSPPANQKFHFLHSSFEATHVKSRKLDMLMILKLLDIDHLVRVSTEPQVT